MDRMPDIIHGCQSHSCVIQKPRGQATNGPCMCDEKMLKRYILWFKLTQLDTVIAQLIDIRGGS